MISDERMAEAAEKLFQAMLDSLPDEEECAPEFSAKFEHKMKRLIHRTEHPVRYRVLQKVASIILVLFMGFATLLALSPTVRATFFGWIKEQYETFTKYYFEGTAQEDVTNYTYELAVLPDGYEEVSRNSTLDVTVIYYADIRTNELMHFTYSHKYNTAEHYIESLEYTKTYTFVHNISADYYQSNTSEFANVLVWEDASTNTLFRLTAFLDVDSIVRIAENIIKIKK